MCCDPQHSAGRFHDAEAQAPTLIVLDPHQHSVQSVEITWPSGTHQRLTDITADQVLLVEEPPQ